HLLAGRVNPETLTPQWDSNRRTADIAAVLETALASRNVVGTLETLVPRQYGYQRLREALAHYRRIAVQGGWPAIPEGVTLRLGDGGHAVAALRQRLRLEDDIGIRETAPAPQPQGQDAELFDEALEEGVKRFQRRHGLTPDGSVS